MFLQEQHSLSKHVFSRNNTLSNHISPGTTSLKACFSGNNLSQNMFLQEQHSLSKRVSPGTPLSLSQSMFLQEHHSLSKRVSPRTTSLKACFFRSNTLTCFSNRQKKKKKKRSAVKLGCCCCLCCVFCFLFWVGGDFFVKYNAPLILLVFDVKSYLDNCITVMVTWALITNRHISLVCCQQEKCTSCRPEVWC